MAKKQTAQRYRRSVCKRKLRACAKLHLPTLNRAAKAGSRDVETLVTETIEGLGECHDEYLSCYVKTMRK